MQDQRLSVHAHQLTQGPSGPFLIPIPRPDPRRIRTVNTLHAGYALDPLNPLHALHALISLSSPHPFRASRNA